MRRPVRPARARPRKRAGARDGIDAVRRAHPAALRALPAAGRRAWLEARAVAARHRSARHGARTAAPLPRASPFRRGAAVARHLPDACVRAVLRIADPGRAAATDNDYRSHADPRRGRARFRGLAAGETPRCRRILCVIRRAELADADFIAGLVEHEEVAPFLSAVRATGLEATRERIERSQREPAEFGIFVIEE